MLRNEASYPMMRFFAIAQNDNNRIKGHKVNLTLCPLCKIFVLLCGINYLHRLFCSYE